MTRSNIRGNLNDMGVPQQLRYAFFFSEAILYGIKVSIRARGEMDITTGFGPVIGGSNPSERTAFGF